ncbi:DUF5050 domain-containing protein [Paenibacillus sp. GSMTC-2017]|uniref:DUF5050 domain-containing protein n=1 Tax=Paenibacillus sp. GSMTC-2017 TaxID=2794350 RepID=UPI0018D9CDE1|nr:DUF5050 domain-containing protein [Paenibacillus sp. GSMTC-2017]MBH5320059.1 DUF5050 domain-containing protein [Paenibacillus sp. GSMTC-2017]
MTGNIPNGGLVLQVRDHLIVTDVKSYSGTRLLSIDSNETKQKATDSLLWYMNTDGIAVYYSNQRKGHALYRLLIDSMSDELLLNKPCGHIVLHKDWIYYIDENSQHLYRCHMNGQEDRVVVKDKIWSFVLVNGKIIYSTPMGIKMCDESSSSHELITDATGYLLIRVGERIAFSNQKGNDALTLMGLDGSHPVTVDGIQAASLNTDGEYIYCTNALNNRSIYRVDPISLRNIRISGQSADYLHIFRNTLYYCSDHEWYQLSLSGGEATKIIL